MLTLIIILLIGVVAWLGIVIIPVNQEWVIVRMGKKRILNKPGMYFLILFIDKIESKKDTKPTDSIKKE